MKTQEVQPQVTAAGGQTPPAAAAAAAENPAGSSLDHKKAVLATLCKLFPKTFITEGEIRPLKVGIINELLASPLFAQFGASRNMVRRAVRFYATSTQYLNAVKEGAVRIDLDGNDSDTVTAEHEKYAQELIKTLAAKREAAEKRQRELAAQAAAPKTAKPGLKPAKKFHPGTRPQWKGKKPVTAAAAKLSPEELKAAAEAKKAAEEAQKKAALEAAAAAAAAAAAEAAAEASRKKAEEARVKKELAKFYVGRPVTFKNKQGKLVKATISKKPANGKVTLRTSSGAVMTIPLQALQNSGKSK